MHCLPETYKSSPCTLLCAVFQVTTDAGVDTLIPVSLQGKDNPILQQLLPTLLNPALLGVLLPTLFSQDSFYYEEVTCL